MTTDEKLKYFTYFMLNNEHADTYMFVSALLNHPFLGVLFVILQSILVVTFLVMIGFICYMVYNWIKSHVIYIGYAETDNFKEKDSK